MEVVWSGLADCLRMLGQREAAVAQCEEMLRLNPNDNQGIRHTLASRFLDMDDDQRLGQLLSADPDDGMADFTYTRALWSFRRQGAA